MRTMILGLCAALACASLPAEAVREWEGSTAAGARYRIVAPDDWRDGDALVMYQHGLDFAPTRETPGLGPLRDLMLGEGYAIAASSFRQRGWALFHAVADNRDLLEVFEREVGEPGEILPFGGSMGGLVALRLAEARGFPPVRGVFALCPAAAGSRLWDAAIDLRLAFDVVCEGAGAGDLPIGSEPLEWALDLGDIPLDLGDLGDRVRVLEALVALNRCTGVNLPPALRNDAMRERLAELMQVARVDDEDFLVTQVAYAIFVLSELVRAPDALAGANPFTTLGVDYGDLPDVEAGIERIVADPAAASLLRRTSDFTGNIGSAKILSMHTSGDQLVVAANQEFLRERVPPAQLVSAIVAEDEPSHCGFSDAEGIAGWESLRRWIDGAPKPAVASLQALCTEIVAFGGEGPCRFDADAELPAFDSLVRPRAATTPIETPVRARNAPAGTVAPRVRAQAPLVP